MIEHRDRAIIPGDPDSLAVPSRLAERTLAERALRAESLLVGGRILVVGPGGYATINKAMAVARDGDTILVRPGTYRESVTITEKVILAGDGNRDDIIIESDAAVCLRVGPKPVLLTDLTVRGGGASSDWGGSSAVMVSGGSPILEGLVLVESHGIRLMRGASPFIYRCVIRDGPRAGIWVEGGATGAIEDNEVCGNGLFGIVVWGSDGAPLIRANRIHGNDCGIWVGGGARPTIEGNDIRLNRNRGIWVDGAAPLIRANRIRGNDGPGIFIRDGAGGSIEDNELVGNAGGAVSIVEGATPTIFGNVCD